MRNLGSFYETGTGVRLDPEKAADLYRQASTLGNARATRNLAYMYYFGRGVPYDQKHAAELFQKAAESGGGQAQYDLSRLYYRGHGVERDLTKAGLLKKSGGCDSLLRYVVFDLRKLRDVGAEEPGSVGIVRRGLA